ncbi:DUF2264 domain-containing protein [Gorillibacterium sp. sgz5001074]|uniref:DUF2264 domain-containing protein n=1 Tax=Gorillibacterium sp. sgz5001074 TaxID=3446695 RepID=UPI003F672EAD
METYNEHDSKAFYEQMLLSMVEPLMNRFSPGKARLELGAETAGYGNRVAGMEAFSRLLWGMVPYWAGGGKDERLLPVFLEGIANGTDPSSPEYWGDLHHKDQRMVEMAAIAYGLLMIPDKLWEPLEERVRHNLSEWLGQINRYTLAENNWQYFNVLTNLALKSIGRPYSTERMEEAMAKYESYYLGNGWYSDGLRPQKDYYISFAIHYYCLLYAKWMKKDDPARSERFQARAKTFAQTFLYWFDEEGKALPYGRSMAYRFAQAAFWSVYAMTGLDGFSPGVLKGIIGRHLRYWARQPMYDNGGVLTIGYTYPNLNMSEGYNAAGSPYWAFKTFAFLALPDGHEFWRARSEPLPELDQQKVIPECNMLITRRGSDVTALTAGQYPVLQLTHAAEKYAKFAYSSRFGFSCPRSYWHLHEAGTDSMLAFYVNRMVYVRRECLDYSVSETGVYARWSPVEGIDVETWLIPTDKGHIRRHTVTSQVECTAYDCGFSYPDRQEETRSHCSEGTAEVTDANGCSRVRSETGRGMVITSAPNTNLIFPTTRIPAVEYQIPVGRTTMETRVDTEFREITIRIGAGNGYEICGE